jgi:hypothetical protein
MMQPPRAAGQQAGDLLSPLGDLKADERLATEESPTRTDRDDPPADHGRQFVHPADHTFVAVLTPGGSALAGLLAGGGAYTGAAAGQFMATFLARRAPGADSRFVAGGGTPRERIARPH